MIQLTIESNSGNFAQNMTILIVIIMLIIVGIIYTKVHHDKQFGKWFQELLKQAPDYGFTDRQINDFEEIFFFDYFSQDLSIGEALKIHFETM